MNRKGVKQIIFQCQNEIYGTITESLLYYNYFRKSLEDEGCEFNPYDLSVTKRIIKDSQINVCFHIDYCKLSHNIPEVVGKKATWLKQEYETIFEYGSGEMTIHQGKVHNYLGMTLEYTNSGTVKVSIIDYIDVIIAAFDETDPRGRGIKTSAVPEVLYKVDEDCENLSPDKAKMFHNLVSKTL